MDICRWNFSTSTESISFQWIIIVMLYLATIILSLSTEAVDERLYLSQRNATAWEHGEVSTSTPIYVCIWMTNFIHFISIIIFESGKQTCGEHLEFAVVGAQCGRHHRLDDDRFHIRWRHALRTSTRNGEISTTIKIKPNQTIYQH